MAARKKTYRVIISPATDNAHKESFVKVNSKVIPFGIPMNLDENTIAAIKRIKEPKRMDKNRSVYAVMDELKISQEKANKLMRANNDMTKDVNIGFVPKYNISKV